MDYLPKKRYEELGQALRHIPEELSEIWLQCPSASCGFVFKPPWLEKRPPLVPVKPNSGHGRWIPQAAVLRCPMCSTEVYLRLPLEKLRARYSWFGDEAFQLLGDKYLLTYSLVGANSVKLPTVEESIRQFKSELCPSVSPDSWRLHMRKIWSGNARRKHPIFRDWDATFIETFVNDFFRLIRDFDDSFRILNVSAIYHQSTAKRQRRLEKKTVKHEAYSLLLVKAIDKCTKNGIQPHFMFDSEKDSDADNVIHEWAKNAFEGSHVNLVFPFLARGIEIPEPMFVSPASRPCLQVADFVSFVVRRYCYKRMLGEPIDLDPAELGSVEYLGFDPDGDMLFTSSTGYPWEYFYGNA